PRLAELNEYEQAGWLVECRLALSVYIPDTEGFIGEAAWMAYDPGQSGADAIFAVFIENITGRIAEGSHPRLSLDQDQFEQVMESAGHWFLTKSEPLADLPKGSLIHKRRRNWADYLAQAAAAHRLGCNIAAWLFLAAIAGTVVFLVFVLPRL
ncbi:MAG: hypothetical protein FWH50_01285, partial [Coriobacteriia bacterium]|nr:hypothetical protein [Coriobacteriia bacterium]